MPQLFTLCKSRRSAPKPRCLWVGPGYRLFGKSNALRAVGERYNLVTDKPTSQHIDSHESATILRGITTPGPSDKETVGLATFGAADHSPNNTKTKAISVTTFRGEDPDSDMIAPCGGCFANYPHNPVVFFGHPVWPVAMGTTTSKIEVDDAPRPLPFFPSNLKSQISRQKPETVKLTTRVPTMGNNRKSARDDRAALDSLEKKHHVVRDYVNGVAERFKFGLYLYGPGGVGKSFTVLDYLKKRHPNYQLFNSRMTAKGLFLALQKAPKAVHVLEDMERLSNDGNAQGVLRSALWAQPGDDRVVTWTTATGAQGFTFSGGLIMIGNRPLADVPELRALATRIEVHRFEVTDAELTALMRDLASRGYCLRGEVVEPEACLQVTEYLLKVCRAACCPLDLRLQQKAFQTYLQFAADQSVCHWEDLVACSVREATCHFRHELNTTSPEARKAQRRCAIRAIVLETADTNEQCRLYTEQTGASRADFYRRKREVDSGEFDVHDAK